MAAFEPRGARFVVPMDFTEDFDISSVLQAREHFLKCRIGLLVPIDETQRQTYLEVSEFSELDLGGGPISIAVIDDG